MIDQVHGQDDKIETMECRIGERDADNSDSHGIFMKNVTTPGSRFVKDEKLVLVLTYSDPDQDDVDAEMKTESKSTDDLVLLRTCDGGELQASCSVLSQSSIVFDRMFANDWQEKTAHCVDIKEFSVDTMRGFLSFINVGVVQSLETIDIELYEVGEVYQVEKLKELCSDSMASRVTDGEHTSEILQFAALHEDLFDRCCITLAW